MPPLQGIAMMLALLPHSIDLLLTVGTISAILGTRGRLLMRPSRQPIQCHRNTL